MLKNHKITGGGGIQLHIVEAGKPSGRPIIFIHGVSQCWLTWSRQMSSVLADGHRLVAIDLRGHVFLISLERATRNRDCGLMM